MTGETSEVGQEGSRNMSRSWRTAWVGPRKRSLRWALQQGEVEKGQQEVAMCFGSLTDRQW